MRIHESYRNPFWTEDENIEMATRVMVRDDFSNLVKRCFSVSFILLLAVPLNCMSLSEYVTKIFSLPNHKVEES
jgi:hypothetical protein